MDIFRPTAYPPGVWTFTDTGHLHGYRILPGIQDIVTGHLHVKRFPSYEIGMINHKWLAPRGHLTGRYSPYFLPPSLPPSLTYTTGRKKREISEHCKLLVGSRLCASGLPWRRYQSGVVWALGTSYLALFGLSEHSIWRCLSSWKTFNDRNDLC